MRQFSRKKVLLTGATGLCGKTIAEIFLSHNNHIDLIPTSRSDASYKNHIVHDLSKELPLGCDGFPHHIDAIIHTAAIIDEKTESFDIIKNNLLYSFNVAKYAKNTKARTFINLSSIAVYGSPLKDAMYDESTSCNPISNYGISKFLSEKLFEAYLPERLRLINIRLGYVLSQNMHESYVTSKFYNALKNNKDVLLVNGDTSFLNIVDARDLAKVCLLIQNASFNGTLNIVGKNSICIGDILKIIQSIIPESKSKIIEKTSKEMSIRAIYDNTLYTKIFPTLSLRTPKETIEWAFSKEVKNIE
jgi:nucleoside-diphosphate-sugar epimerase